MSNINTEISRFPVTALIASATTTTDSGKTTSYMAELFCSGHGKRLRGSSTQSSTNEAALVALIETVKALKHPCELAVYTANNYIINVASTFDVWRERDGKRLDGKPMAFHERWVELNNVIRAGKHEVTYHHATAYGKDDLCKRTGVVLAKPGMTAKAEAAPQAVSASGMSAVAQARAIAAKVDPSVVDMIEAE